MDKKKSRWTAEGEGEMRERPQHSALLWGAMSTNRIEIQLHPDGVAGWTRAWQAWALMISFPNFEAPWWFPKW